MYLKKKSNIYLFIIIINLNKILYLTLIYINYKIYNNDNNKET